MLVTSVVNQKGGAGKTPTAVHLAFALAKTGGKVLFIDLDPQATASYHFIGKLYKEQEPTIYTQSAKSEYSACLNIRTKHMI